MTKELIQKFLNKACWDEQAQQELEDWLNVEKFAELIIRESVAVADDYVKDCTCEEHINCKHPRSAIGRKIREHFGVEE